jgi:branched-chain amino acid transport system substrate-binding protein
MIQVPPRILQSLKAGISTLCRRVKASARLAFVVAPLIFTSQLAQAQAPIKIAIIDPLSGPFAAQGESSLLQLRFAVEELVNSQGGLLGGRQIEILALDNKASAQESQIQLRRAIGEGVQFVFSGNSSAVAAVLSSALDRHNRRNPNQQIMYLNHSAVETALTEQDCNFWHFRFDAHADMKLDALTDYISSSDISRLYVLGQDYSFGKTIQESTVKMLNEKRPDIQIVGNELHPIGQVRDFTPYVTRIVPSRADAILTGNWGADMVSLARAIIDAGLNVPIFTFYAAYDGITATLGAPGKDRIYLVHNDRANVDLLDSYVDYNRRFKARNPNHDISQPRIANAIMMLAKAIEEAGTTNPYDVALAMEDMRITSISGEELWMRPDDHQTFQPINISVHTNEGIIMDADNSGYGLKTIFTVATEDTIRETSCRMERPRR